MAMNIRFSAWFAGLACALAVVSPPVHAAEPEPALSPSMQAYQDVSVARDRHDELVWGGKNASPEEIRAAIRDLDVDLAKMEQPLVRDLAEGNMYLRYRRYNILIDTIKLHARVGEPEKALARWRELTDMQWAPEPGLWASDDPHVKALISRPEFAEIATKQRVARWWSLGLSLKTEYRAELPLDERIAGLSRVWAVAREGFVWFDHVPELDWDLAYRQHLSEAIAAKDTETYYRVLMRFVALLADGHSNVYAPDALRETFYSRPGLRTALVEGKVVVVSIDDPALTASGMAVGDELVRVDDVPVRAYAERSVGPYVSSSTPQDREIRMYRYALLSGDAQRPMRLELRDRSGGGYTVAARRSGYEKSRAPDAAASKSVSALRLRDDGVAVLRADQFENDSALKSLEADFALLAKAKGLILDLRGNGGGSTYHGTRILAHLSRAPLPTMTSRYREGAVYGFASVESPWLQWRTIDVEGNSRVPEQVYEGPVAMLIDAATFSAAEDTAAVFRLMKRGPIIGVASGGSSGQPFVFGLPGGGMARICVKRDTYPDGSSFVGIGVLPDIVAARTLRDVRRGEDSALERAVRALSSH